MPYFEKKIISGKYTEIEQFFYAGKGTPRSKGKKETQPNMAAYNEKQSEKDFIRTLHCNFDPAAGDLFATLTFTEAVERPEAAKEFRNFEQRAKRHCKKKNQEYKRLSAIEKQGKWHIHIVLSGLTLDELNCLWGRGRVTASILDDTNQYKDLAGYLFKNEKQDKTLASDENIKEPRPKNAKRWSGTRNLKKPVITVKPIKREGIMSKIPAAPKGSILLPGWVLSCDACGHLVRRYTYVSPFAKPPKKHDREKRRKLPPSK